MENYSSKNAHNRKILLQLFGELEEDLLDQILETGNTHEVEIGQFLFHQGDKENSLYIDFRVDFVPLRSRVMVHFTSLET